MSDSSTIDWSWFRTQLPGVLRLAIVGLLFGPALSKFVTYERSVRFFTGLGLPSPDVLVLVVGAVELGAAILLLLNRASRVAALLVVPTMVVAAITAGPTWQNLGVLTGAVVLIGLDTQEVDQLV